MATTKNRWLLRLAPWFLPVGLVALWQLASSMGWLSNRILPSPEGVIEAFWTLSASGCWGPSLRRSCSIMTGHWSTHGIGSMP